MSLIKPLDDFSTLIPQRLEAQRGQGELAQEDFLELMITQFRNQDPFQPMENGDFLAQIAQFSTVSGIEELNASFSGLSSSIQEEQALKAARRGCPVGVPKGRHGLVEQLAPLQKRLVCGLELAEYLVDGNGLVLANELEVAQVACDEVLEALDDVAGCEDL